MDRNNACAMNSFRGQPLLILWGVPGAGKSRFASHLADKEGFTFIDTDAGQVSGQLHASWFAMINRQATPRSFLAAVASHGDPVVAEFGLWATAANIELLRELQSIGAEPWWFNGDRGAAFASWQDENRRRGRFLSDALWHQVVAVIDVSEGALREFYGPDRMLRTVDSGPTHVGLEWLRTTILGDRADGDHAG